MQIAEWCIRSLKCVNIRPCKAIAPLACTIIGANLSEPHIDHDNSPRARNNGIYVCIIYPVFVAPLFPLCLEMLCVFQYIDVLTCLIYNCICTQTRMTGVCCEDYRRRQAGECADTWYKQQIQPTETCCCQSETTDGLTVLLFCDIYIDIGATLNLLQCLCVICGCRADQYN